MFKNLQHSTLNWAKASVAATITLFGIQSASQAQTLEDSLAIYLPMDGDAKDASGNGNDGEFDTAPTDTTNGLGQSNTAYYFNGVDNLIKFPIDNSYMTDLPITVGVWIKLDELGNTQKIFSSNNDGSQYSGIIMNVGPTGTLNMSYGGGGSAGPGGRRTASGQTTLSANEWYYITAVFKGASNIDLYINGAPETVTFSGSGGSIVYLTNGKTHSGHLGGYDHSASTGITYYKGFMDDFKLWTRELSAGEIELEYTRKSTGLLLHYALEGNASDSSQNGNDGMLIGSPVYTDDEDNNTDAAIALSANQYIDVSSATTDFTVLKDGFSMVMKANFTANTAHKDLVQINGTGLFWRIDRNSDEILIGYGSTGGLKFCGDDDVVDFGNWHEYALTWDGMTIKHFVDSTLSYECDMTGKPIILNAINSFKISNGAYDVDISDFKIYDRAHDFDNGMLVGFNWDTQKTDASRLEISPNPASHDLFIQVNGAEFDAFNYTISDVTGIPLKTGLVTASGIDISDLEAGVYIISAQNSVEHFSHKVIIE